jgi:DNA-directed RNA polymerase specialized sigma24 family protein
MADPDPQPSPAGFATTRWTLIRAARDHSAPETRAALAALCAAYWYPLYAFVRRQGYDPDQAQDLTQGFFARLLEKDGLALADQARGRFRSFLLAACKHFLSNERDRERALKRGGGRPPVSIDVAVAEGCYGREPSHTETPERLFQRRWALSLLEHVLQRLRGEYETAGKGGLFGRLKGHLAGGGEAHAQAAADLGMSEGAIKVAVHRLRHRYRDLLREEIAGTLDDPAAIDDEIRELFAALGS